jgi:hypothetical protein
LRKRADALEAYVNLLESKLEKCWREHGGLNEDRNAYLQFRPDAMVIPDDVNPSVGYGDEDEDMASDTGDEIIRELCLPTKNLVVRPSFTNNSDFQADSTCIYNYP